VTSGPVYDDRDFVFCDELGGSLRPNGLTQWFAARRKRAGIPTGTLHTLRHTAITLMLTNGVRCTSSRPGRAIARRRCCRYMRTCSRRATSRRRTSSPVFSLAPR